MRYRQIHLDFHTSERIPGIGSRFDPKKFARTLPTPTSIRSRSSRSAITAGRITRPRSARSIRTSTSTCCARRSTRCHKAGINAPVYTSAVWDELAGRENPGWRVVSPETGAHVRQRATPTGAGWAFLDLDSPYLDYLCRQVDEVMTLFGDADGIFIDICFQLESVSPWAQTPHGGGQGLDWTNPEDRLEIHRAGADRVLRARPTGAYASTTPKCRSSTISATSAAAGATC